MTDSRYEVGGLSIAAPLYKLVTKEIVPGTGIDAFEFWAGLEKIISEFSPKNRELLQERVELQSQIDEWHSAQKDQPQNLAEYQQFLLDIGYLLPEINDFQITTSPVDPEIAEVAGPQLVVPVLNTRYSLSAANARWGSLYAAIYNSDVLQDNGSSAKNKPNSSERKESVIEFAKEFLDEAFPLSISSHRKVSSYTIKDQQLVCVRQDGTSEELINNDQFVGYRGDPVSPSAILLNHNGLHVEIQIDRDHPVGKMDCAGVKDLLMEAALTTIQDFEDSVAAVDTEDKVAVYRNWLGLMKGDLSENIFKDGKDVVRALNPDREYTDMRGGQLIVPGRSLMLARNVGLHMTTDMVQTQSGESIPEGILDGMITSLSAIHSLKNMGGIRNSRCSNVYIVVPKMHGPDEVAYTVRLFDKIEEVLGLDPNTLKLGLMDEERRTSLNLKQCIYEAKERLIFINTGFLDRTGDEIRTSMKAGPMVPKDAMKKQEWLRAYEDRNVVIGLRCGLKGKAQIGKGMWPAPDNMAQMLETKIDHLNAGANCAWVPSPLAAVLHVLHYHKINVAQRQDELVNAEVPGVSQLLTIPLLADKESLTPQDIKNELDNNIQGILGYVVRWINKGVGCSKVPDINGVGLMEDRATLRISSQHVANWLFHGVCSVKQVEDSMRRMAVMVDQQNANDADYYPMATNLEHSIAFVAACDLVFNWVNQPNGYTESVLHAGREAFKKLDRDVGATLTLFRSLDSSYKTRQKVT